MKKKFKSKIGLELLIPLGIVFGILFILSITNNPGWPALVMLCLLFLFVVHLFMTTYYVINGNKLTIKCGFLYNKTIDITTINKISETNNPLSSPATSIDRLELTYGKFDSVLISPKQKKEFINAMIAINSGIEVQLKQQ
jgi:hypothetical protein